MRVRVLDNVPRVDRPAPAEMLERFLAPPHPVVIRNLYAGDPLGAITTREQAIEAWGDAVLPVQLEYTTQAATGQPRRIDLMKVRDFLALPPDDPSTVKRVITEQDTPPAIRAMFEPPPYGDLAGVPREDLVTKVFLAHAGHYAHLHYDVDGRPVILTQLFGHKRVMVVPPEQNQAIDPYTEERGGNMSSRYIEHLTPDEKLAFAREVGAFDTLIGPCESIFIPTGWWHYIDYVDTAMSINVRFGRTPLQAELYRVSEGLASCHLHYWQMIAQPFRTGGPPSMLEDEAWHVVRLLDRARAGGPDEAAEFGRAVEALYRKIAPTGYTRTLRLGDVLRQTPITELWTRPPEPWQKPPDRPPPVWAATSVPALATGVEPVVGLGTGAVILLRDGAPVWKIESADGDALRVLRELLAALVAAPGASIAALAARIECPVEELVELLEELAETGCLSHL